MVDSGDTEIMTAVDVRAPLMPRKDGNAEYGATDKVKLIRGY